MPTLIASPVTPRERLTRLLGPDLLDAVDAYLDARISEALAAAACQPRADLRWLTLEQAAERLGCSTDAVRMRARRGRLKMRRHGRRVYVSAASVETLGCTA